MHGSPCHDVYWAELETWRPGILKVVIVVEGRSGTDGVTDMVLRELSNQQYAGQPKTTTITMTGRPKVRLTIALTGRP